ncbi:MAG: hypothetical protein U0744_15930 [Gemmataceae bacterium]
MSCPHCRESARFVGYRKKTVVSLVGDLRLWRGYYHCSQCSQGQVPWDKTLSLANERLTPAAQEVTSLAGIQESFGKAADLTLRKLAGLRLSESTVERTAESAGMRLGRLIKEGKTFGPKKEWAWNKDRTGKTCAYVSLDATGVLMQGPEGSKVEGRMVNVGMVFNPQPRSEDEEALSKPCDGVRYLAGLYTLGELGEAMRKQAAQVGMDQAQQWIALSDGGRRTGGVLRRALPVGRQDPRLSARGRLLGGFGQVVAAGRSGRETAVGLVSLAQACRRRPGGQDA